MSARAHPSDLGFRWPAEWEPHSATWLSWPHNPETWPGCLDGARRAFAEIVRALQGREDVHINVADDAHQERARDDLRNAGVDPEQGIHFFLIPTDDAWARDHAPIFLTREDPENPELALLDFGFNAWGGKYPPWDRDDAVPRAIAAAMGVKRFTPGFVLEGGSVDTDGRGSVLTTEACLLNPNRGPGRTREGMERELALWLGAERIFWLRDGIEGDDTDGHIDDIARFVEPSTVVCGIEEDDGDPNAAILSENRNRLRAMRDAQGKPLTVATLPMPPPLWRAGVRLPASYLNFYLANGVALVPTFGAASDAPALATLAELLRGREIVPIRCEDLVVGLGAIHCVTQQVPDPEMR